jgi:beta-glucosidase
VARTYDASFLWGAAISAHQVEGVSGGGEKSDWYEFEHTPGNILNGDTADVATDHWHRYSEDFEIARDLGLNTIRTSIAWEKVEPGPSEYDLAPLQHYREMLERMRDLGVRPMVTLLHGTTPLWFGRRGGWLSDDSPQAFSAYGQFVVDQLKDVCDLWATMNEPMVLIGDGYLEGKVPPRISSPADALKAAGNMVRAHRLLTARLHEIQPLTWPNTPGVPLRGIGLVNSLDLYDPLDESNPLDRGVTDIVSDLSNWALLKAAMRGTVELRRSVAGVRLPGTVHVDFHQDDGEIGGTGSPVADWIGINYYTRNVVQFRWFDRPEIAAPAGPKGDNGWTVYPEGLERILRDAAERFPGVPLVVTENGMSDGEDRLRPQLIRDTLRSLDLAATAHDGKPAVDVRGYYHWSLTDNFEWESGYSQRFGLVRIEYEHGLKRVPRGSARVYSDEIRSRSQGSAAAF